MQYTSKQENVHAEVAEEEVVARTIGISGRFEAACMLSAIASVAALAARLHTSSRSTSVYVSVSTRVAKARSSSCVLASCVSSMSVSHLFVPHPPPVCPTYYLEGCSLQIYVCSGRSAFVAVTAADTQTLISRCLHRAAGGDAGAF